MHFVYIDDSKDGAQLYFSALIIPSDQWREALGAIVSWRKDINQRYGVFVQKEIHATDWLAGRGRISPRIVSKMIRANLFREFLQTIAALPGAQLINASAHKSKEEQIFERMLNRVQKNMEVNGSEAILFCDQGKSYDRLLRKMRHFNYIPSRFGAWGSGDAARNVPLTRILEDIVYRDSRKVIFYTSSRCMCFQLA